MTARKRHADVAWTQLPLPALQLAAEARALAAALSALTTEPA